MITRRWKRWQRTLRGGTQTRTARRYALPPTRDNVHLVLVIRVIQLEQQRKYLGGDSEHTVLVKGLDFALLEQNKARLAASTAVEDDDTLEQAFIEGSSTVPKKRTRDDILRELKSKRLKGEPVPDLPAETTDAALEEAKKAGKFKPIGFKPIGSSGKKKKAKEGDKDGAKKKKKKTAGTEEAQAQPTTAAAEENAAPSQQSTTKPPPPPPEPLDDDDDIFAGAGEYTGLDLGDDDDDEDAADKHAEKDMSDGELPEPAPRRWVDIDDPTPVLPRKSSSPSRAAASPSAAPPPRSASPDREREAEADAEEGEAEEEDAPVRLQPLASSAVPSIRELLAMDEEVEKAEKRRARKEKKKGALTAEGKVERDYQRYVHGLCCHFPEILTKMRVGSRRIRRKREMRNESYMFYVYKLSSEDPLVTASFATYFLGLLCSTTYY